MRMTPLFCTALLACAARSTAGENLIKNGVNVALAVRLFDEESISLGKAARLAVMSVAEFMDHLAQLHIPVARPRPGELESELASFA